MKNKVSLNSLRKVYRFNFLVPFSLSYRTLKCLPFVLKNMCFIKNQLVHLKIDKSFFHLNIQHEIQRINCCTARYYLYQPYLKFLLTKV